MLRDEADGGGAAEADIESHGTETDPDYVPDSEDSTDTHADLVDTSSDNEEPADEDGPIEGAPLLILRKVYLDAILDKRKTLEIRSLPLAAGKRRQSLGMHVRAVALRRSSSTIAFVGSDCSDMYRSVGGNSGKPGTA